MLGLGVDLGHALSVGLLGYHLSHPLGSANSLNASLLASPASWISLAFGLEQLNQPRLAGSRLSTSTWAGIGIRPWLGSPWLTLGAESYIHFEPGERALSQARLAIDVTPWPGLHAQAGYALDDRELWFGLRATLSNLEVSAGLGESRYQSGVRENRT